MQPHPSQQLAQGPRQGFEVGPQGAAIPEVGAVVQVTAVGAGVLGDDQQLAHPRGHQSLGLSQDFADGAARQLSPQARDDAEATPMVAALGELQIGEMGWRELDALGRQQAEDGPAAPARPGSLGNR